MHLISSAAKQTCVVDGGDEGQLLQMTGAILIISVNLMNTYDIMLCCQ